MVEYWIETQRQPPGSDIIELQWQVLMRLNDFISDNFARQFAHVFCVFKRLKYFMVFGLETASILVFDMNCFLANSKSSSKTEHYEQKKYACKGCPTKIVFWLDGHFAE